MAFRACQFEKRDVLPLSDQCLDQFQALSRREQPVAGVRRDQDSSIGPAECFLQGPVGRGQIEIVHRVGEAQIAVRVEPLDKSLTLVVEVALHFEFRFLQQLVRGPFAVLQLAAELVLERNLAEVRDVSHHAGQSEPERRSLFLIVVAAFVEIRIGENRSPTDRVKGDSLG